MQISLVGVSNFFPRPLQADHLIGLRLEGGGPGWGWPYMQAKSAASHVVMIANADQNKLGCIRRSIEFSATPTPPSPLKVRA